MRELWCNSVMNGVRSPIAVELTHRFRVGRSKSPIAFRLVNDDAPFRFPLPLINFRMPSRDGFYPSSGVSAKCIDLTDRDIPHAQRGGTTAMDNSFTSALDSSSSSRPTALRRRGSDDGSSASWGNYMSPYHARARTTDDTSDPHPLRRSSSTTKTARQDMDSTRPRLSRALTPSTPELSRPIPQTDKMEAHRTVLVHEVR